MEAKTLKELYRIQKQVIQTSGISKSPLPIIRSVFVRPDWTGIRGTNLDCQFDVCHGLYSNAPVPALLDAKQALTYQGSPFTVDGSDARFENGVIVPAHDAVDYPANRDLGEECYAESGTWAPFHQALAFVAPSRSDDLTRPALTGVMMDGKRMVATDGHRLSSHPYRLRDDWSGEITLEASLVRMLLKLPSRDGTNLRMVTYEHGVHFQVDYVSGITASFNARFSEGPYPNVDQVIPKQTDTAITLSREVLLDLLKLAKPTWSHVKKAVNFQLEKDTLSLACENSDGERFNRRRS